jgi:hypothetical protein
LKFALRIFALLARHVRLTCSAPVLRLGTTAPPRTVRLALRYVALPEVVAFAAFGIRIAAGMCGFSAQPFAALTLTAIAWISLAPIAQIASTPIAHVAFSTIAHIPFPAFAHVAFPTIAHIPFPAFAHVAFPTIAHVSFAAIMQSAFAAIAQLTIRTLAALADAPVAAARLRCRGRALLDLIDVNLFVREAFACSISRGFANTSSAAPATPAANVLAFVLLFAFQRGGSSSALPIAARCRHDDDRIVVFVVVDVAFAADDERLRSRRRPPRAMPATSATRSFGAGFFATLFPGHTAAAGRTSTHRSTRDAATAERIVFLLFIKQVVRQRCHFAAGCSGRRLFVNALSLALELARCLAMRSRRCDRRLGLHGGFALASAAPSSALRCLQRLGKLRASEITVHRCDAQLRRLAGAVCGVLDLDDVAVHCRHAGAGIRQSHVEQLRFYLFAGCERLVSAA